MEENVNHPSHYAWLKETCGVEAIDIARHMNFDLGNAVKYILRAGKKCLNKDSRAAKIEDLQKAIWYINDEIDRFTEKQPELRPKKEEVVLKKPDTKITFNSPLRSDSDDSKFRMNNKEYKKNFSLVVYRGLSDYVSLSKVYCSIKTDKSFEDAYYHVITIFDTSSNHELDKIYVTEDKVETQDIIDILIKLENDARSSFCLRSTDLIDRIVYKKFISLFEEKCRK